MPVAWVAAPLATYSGIHSVPLLCSFAALCVLVLLADRETPGARRHLGHALAAAITALGLSGVLYLLPSDTNRVVVQENRVQKELKESPSFCRRSPSADSTSSPPA